MLPGQAGKAPGVRPGKTGDRECPAPVGAPISEGLEQGVLDSGAESVTITGLVVGTVVHEGGESVPDAYLHRGLGSARADPLGQTVGIIAPDRRPLPEMVEQSSTDHAYEGAGTGQIMQVGVEPDVLGGDPDGKRCACETGRLCGWRLGRHSAAHC
jgi:hypothetical protein